jgi:hypothetical protein
MDRKPIAHIRGDIISVCGYKSLVTEQSVEIRPLTILSGANSSGKSSIMQPLLLIKQTLETPYDPGALLLNGPNVRITSANQLLSKISGTSCTDNFYLKMEGKEGWNIKLSFKKFARKGLDIENITLKRGKNANEIILQPEISNEEIATLMPNLPVNVDNLLESLKKGSTDFTWVVSRDRCFFSIRLEALKGNRRITIFDFNPTPPLKDIVEKIIHVPALRGNPERTYKTTAVSDNFPGTFQEYVASVIHHWQRGKSEKLSRLGKALEFLGLSWKVEARAVDDTQVELRVGRLPHGVRGGAHDLVSIADVGFGLSQVLPVIVALLKAKQEQIVYIEEPEIHLHPRAQFYLASILADAAKRKVKVIIETHSSLILRGIQTLIAKGELSESLVKLHWFRRANNGATEVFSSDIDQNGAFGDWPEDFDEVQLKSEIDYLDAVEKRTIQ